MLALQRGAISSAATPLFTAATAAAGVLVDAAALSFTVWDVHCRTQPPEQIHSHTVDLDADALGVGRYAAAWTVPSTAPFGRYQIRWTATIDTLDPTDNITPYERTLTWSEDFEILPIVETVEHRLALVSDLRDEGVLAAMLDWRLLDALSTATAQVRAWLGREMMPVYKTVRLDTRGIATVILPEPACALEEVRFEDSGSVVSPEGYRVRARHLTESNATHPDRQAPSIEFLGAEYFANVADYAAPGALPMTARRGAWRSRRPQNAILKGIFGVTEPDGSSVGRTPRNIRRAVVMLAARDVVPLGRAQQRFDANNSFRVSQMRTREQTIAFEKQMGGPDAVAPFSGDPEIDRLLLPFLAPVSVSVP